MKKELGFNDEYFENKINYLFGYLEEVDKEISEKSEALSAVLMKLGEAAYQGEQDMASAEADDTNTSQDNDDVVDAEFEEVDDDKDAKKA